MTNWAAVQRAARSDFTVAGVAQEELLRTYLPVMRGYLLGVRSVSPSNVDDLLQGFVADKMLRGGLFGKADPSRGRFRNLLLKSLSNYLASWFSRRSRDPTVLTDEGELPDLAVTTDQSACFDWAWAHQTVLSAIEAMEGECAKKGRMDVWEVFQGRIAHPAFDGLPEMPYGELVARLKLSSPRQAVDLLTTAKRMFRRCLRETIGWYAAGSEAVESEMGDLRSILARTRNLGGKPQ